ncbi:hypothetical protein GBF38_002479 [Nibea albiflora]|uniref:Uncharacterized protein n=1 Tax=Nibea albiflora TaxID=240163 RepID=A0ACB7EDT9_NIBAL|nr:hypothetical protein GBF38_002479 [Nibea albiflora]
MYYTASLAATLSMNGGAEVDRFGGAIKKMTEDTQRGRKDPHMVCGLKTHMMPGADCTIYQPDNGAQNALAAIEIPTFPNQTTAEKKQQMCTCECIQRIIGAGTGITGNKKCGAASFYQERLLVARNLLYLYVLCQFSLWQPLPLSLIPPDAVRGFFMIDITEFRTTADQNNVAARCKEETNRPRG